MHRSRFDLGVEMGASLARGLRERLRSPILPGFLRNAPWKPHVGGSLAAPQPGTKHPSSIGGLPGGKGQVGPTKNNFEKNFPMLAAKGHPMEASWTSPRRPPKASWMPPRPRGCFPDAS